MASFAKTSDYSVDPLAGATLARIDAAGFRRALAHRAFGDRRLELLDGYIVEMGGQFVPHAEFKAQLFMLLREALLSTASGLRVSIEPALRISRWSEPAPDLIVWDYVPVTGHVPVDRARIVVEISDSSLFKDLGVKRRLYAAARVPEYWVFDLNGRRVHQLWFPESTGYQQQREFDLGQSMRSETIADLGIATDTLD